MGKRRVQASDLPFRKSLLFLTLATFGSQSQAQVSFELMGQLQYLDNPRRQADNEGADLLRQVAAGFGYVRETSRFNTSLNYHARKLDYRDNQLQDRTFVSGSGNIVWKAIPDTLTWHLSNSRTWQPLILSEPDTSDNRQVVDIRSTGPSLTLRPGGTSLLNIQLSAMQADYQESTLPSQDRLNGNISLSRYFSPRYTASLNASVLDTDFDGAESLNFERYTASLNQIYTRDRLRLQLEVGQYEMKRELPGFESQDSLLLNGNASYQLSTRSSLSVGYSRSAEDLLSNILALSRSLSPRLPGSGPLRPGNILEEDLIIDRLGDSMNTGTFERVSRDVSYNYSIPDRMTANLSYRNTSRDYEGQGGNQKDESLGLTASFPLRPDLSVGLRARYSKLDFAGQGRKQDRSEVGVFGNYSLGQHTSMGFSLFKTHQSAVLAQDRYSGLNAFISLTYRL